MKRTAGPLWDEVPGILRKAQGLPPQAGMDQKLVSDAQTRGMYKMAKGGPVPKSTNKAGTRKKGKTTKR